MGKEFEISVWRGEFKLLSSLNTHTLTYTHTHTHTHTQIHTGGGRGGNLSSAEWVQTTLLSRHAYYFGWRGYWHRASSCYVSACVAVCCSVLQCVAACCSVLQCAAVCCSGLQWVAVCCSVSSRLFVLCECMRSSVFQCFTVCSSVFQWQCVVKVPSSLDTPIILVGAGRYWYRASSKYVRTCIAVCCSVLQCVAVCCSGSVFACNAPLRVM